MNFGDDNGDDDSFRNMNVDGDDIESRISWCCENQTARNDDDNGDDDDDDDSNGGSGGVGGGVA
ncbi:hypothetical protein E2C01_092435 [Portunus trituberculatus]|uniref:Uncharacterized protein n=1 Tax=Portunus trituberculatus TaxID=210409 RepID=A0A5B7JGF7_PORTR|nr:hypothetical protein [Portunus trituberculatus]